MIVVVNRLVYRINTNLSVTLLSGTLSTASGEVFIDENLNNQICIVDGVDAYIYYHAGGPVLTAQSITASQSDLVPNYVTYHNTYFLFGNGLTNNDGSKWFAYEPNTNTTIQYVTTLALQTKPDFAVAVKRLPGIANNVLVFGRSVCEIWTQVESSAVYRRNSTLNIDFGCISVSTIAASDKYVFWLATNEVNAPVIMMFSGGQAQAISTDGIDKLLEQVVNPSKSTAVIFRQNGHLFYMLTFYDARDNLSIIFDTTTGKFFDMTDEKLDYHPAREMVYFNRTWYFVSLRNAALYQMDPSFTVIDESLGEAVEDQSEFIYDMQRISVTDTVRQAETARFRVNSAVLLIEQGNDPNCSGLEIIDYLVMEDDVGDIIITESGDYLITETSILSHAFSGCPRVDLTVSRDGGFSWSNTVSKTLQPYGKRQNILNWQNMGAANEFIMKFRFWSMDKVLVQNASVEVF
jgi:hypothetical protein